MRSISKKRYDNLDKLRDALGDKLHELSEMGEFLQEKFTVLLATEKNENGSTFMDLLGEIDEARDELYGELQDVVNDAENYYEERSEKWMESEAGEAYEEWKNELEEYCYKFENSEELYSVEVDGECILQAEIEVVCEVEELEELPRQSPTD